MRVLVIGGAGYIGSHTTIALKESGHEPIIYDNFSTGHRFLIQNCEFFDADILERPKLMLALRAVDAVLHFAAHAYVGESVQNPRKYFANNVNGGLCLLDAMVDSGVRKVIFSSTCAVYGIPRQVPILEDAPRQPINPYGVSKLFIEQALEAYREAYGFEYVSLRYFNAAGADEQGRCGELHQPETHLIPLALQVTEGAREELLIYGDDYPTQDGTCVRDYIHVSDLADAHVAALDYLNRGGNPMALNVGTGRGHSVKEVLATVCRVAGPVRVRIVPRRPGDPPVLVADPKRAQHILHWKAARPLEDCVVSAWKWQQIVRSNLLAARS